jgi:hypothetical protein
MADESALARPIKIVLDPDFTPGFIPGVSDPTLGAHDLAVLLFAAGTFAGVDPVRIVRPGGLDRLRARGDRHGPTFTFVGYGTELRDGGFYAAGYRKTTRFAFDALMPDCLLTGSVRRTVTAQRNALLRGLRLPAVPWRLHLAGRPVPHHGRPLHGRALPPAARHAAEQAFLAPYLPHRHGIHPGHRARR